MAMHVGLRRRRAPAAILGYSGLLVGPERLTEATARDGRGAPPPILLVHGDQDPLIPVEAMFMAAEALAQASNSRPMASFPRRRPRHRRRRTAPRRTVSRRGAERKEAVTRATAEAGRLRQAGSHKKGGRPRAAFKSREETPKEGMCGQTAPHRNKIMVRCEKRKNFRLRNRANVYFFADRSGDS